LNAGRVGSIGYRSLAHEHADHTEWIELELGKEVPLDEIMLVPAIRRDSQDGFQADGFPTDFRITAGTQNDRNGILLGEYRASHDILPRIAPVVVSAKGMAASWVRIEATSLSQRAFDGKYIFELSEILVFSNGENVALRRPVSASSSHNERGDSAWNPRFLTDGHTPYLMDAAQGNQSVAYVSPSQKQQMLVIDLEIPFPLSRIHLHAVDQSDTVPQAHAGDLGIPRSLRIEGANSSDFSDSTTLLEAKLGKVNETGPIMMWSIPETTCRYVRLSDTAPSPPGRLGFAEIELFSNGRNVAFGKPASSTPETPWPNPVRSPEALTDGRNLYGNILPIRDWLLQLARRHDLESERPVVRAELTQRYARQKTNLNRVSWLADLHDELGANLHTIGMLGDLARESIDSREELIELIDRIRVFTERSGQAARYCTDMLEANGLYEDLVEEMQRSSARLLADLEYSLAFTGEENLKRLRPRKSIDLFLFYKESLTNIIRHSGATEVKTRLTADHKQVELIIADNGHGLNGEVPQSLKRRARLLGAQVATQKSDTGGTQVRLYLKIRKHGVFR
jgi:signal transduction histidine kinase